MNYVYKEAQFDNLDISSNGRLLFIYGKMLCTLTLTGEVSKINDIDYALITSYQFNIEAEHFSADFESGNLEISKRLNQIVEKYWLYLLSTEKNEYAVYYGKAYKNYAQSVFSVIPYDTLFPK